MFGVVAVEKLPIALAFQSGVFEQENVDYIPIDFNHELYTNLPKDEYDSERHNMLKNPTENMLKIMDSIINRIKEFDPDMISFSVFSYRQNPPLKVFLEKLKQHNLRAVTIAAGPGIWYVSPDSKISFGKVLVNQNLLDYYGLGEGEEVFPRFINGERDMNGINSKQSTTETWADYIKNIDTQYIPPSYKKIPIRNISEKELFISGSRGCVGTCTFCSVRTYIPKPSLRQGHKVADECYRLFKETGTLKFKLVDALINAGQKNFKDFNQRIVELKEQDPAFMGFTYNGMFLPREPEIHKESLFELMKAAGCTHLDVGIESGSERLRFEMSKKYTDRALDWHFEMCQKYGIQNNVSLFVGFPTETDEDFNNTIKMLDRYQQYIEDKTFNEIQHCGIFVMYTKTPIYDNRHDYNIEITDDSTDPCKWVCHNNPTNTESERIRREQVLISHAKKLGYYIDVYDSKDKYDK